MDASHDAAVRRAAHRKEIGQRIKRARRALGLTAAECARRASVTAHALWRYEDGRVLPGSGALVRIASALGTTSEWLVTGVGPGPRARHAQSVSTRPRRIEGSRS